jgi:very-short-patch-repair endonuclease
MTPAELALWSVLAGSKLGVRFRRQEPIGPYIVDFVCLSRLLIVELDGDQHESSEHDARRDAYLAGTGYQVVRFWNEDMAWHPDWLVGQIRAALAGQPLDPEVRVTGSRELSVPPQGGRFLRPEQGRR